MFYRIWLFLAGLAGASAVAAAAYGAHSLNGAVTFAAFTGGNTERFAAREQACVGTPDGHPVKKSSKRIHNFVNRA